MNPSSPTKPKTTLEQVQQAFPGSKAGRSNTTVPGVELFELFSTSTRPIPQDADNLPRVVAIVGGLGSPILEGQDVTRAVIKATKDPAILAKVALAVEQRNGEILTAPKNDEQKKANVGPPKLAGNAVTFWVWTSGVGRMLMLATLDLSSGKLELGGRPISEDEDLDNAIKVLDTSAFHNSLAKLKTKCSNAKVRAALFDILAHGNEERRTYTAAALDGCGAAAVDPLVKALATDASPGVRATAASTLGTLKDKRAKPALEKATHDSNSEVAAAAKEALAKL